MVFFAVGTSVTGLAARKSASTEASTSRSSTLYAAPAPRRKSTLGQSDGDLLSLLPDGLYRRDWVSFQRSGREIHLINEPGGIRQVLVTQEENFPKSDLMRTALTPLLGEGILISDGPIWQRQRVMLEQALAHMRVRRQFQVMAKAIADFVQRLEAIGPRSRISLDAEISFFALDVIFRTIFSRPIEMEEAQEVYGAFSDYQNSVSDESYAMFAVTTPSGSRESLGAFGEQVRGVIDRLIERRLASPAPGADDDILRSMMTSRDTVTGKGFDRTELVDQIAVLFLAGHETSACVLTWCIFLLSQHPDVADQIRREADALAPGRPLTQEELNKLVTLRNVFRETLRLYPPSAFFTRVAKRDTKIGDRDIEAGSLIIVSPWLVHRHREYWPNPECFDFDRFSVEREREIIPGTYLPFGLGPRVCPGRAFAMIEGPLLVAELIRKFKFTAINPQDVVPSYRLVVRSKQPISCLIERHYINPQRLAQRAIPASRSLTCQSLLAASSLSAARDGVAFQIMPK
jgi:cytochrome P450